MHLDDIELTEKGAACSQPIDPTGAKKSDPSVHASQPRRCDEAAKNCMCNPVSNAHTSAREQIRPSQSSRAIRPRDWAAYSTGWVASMASMAEAYLPASDACLPG